MTHTVENLINIVLLGGYKGGTYLLIHFLGNFREKTKKVPTHSLFRKLSEISPKFPKKLEALLLVKQLGTGKFFGFENLTKALVVSYYSEQSTSITC